MTTMLTTIILLGRARLATLLIGDPIPISARRTCPRPCAPRLRMPRPATPHAGHGGGLSLDDWAAQTGESSPRNPPARDRHVGSRGLTDSRRPQKRAKPWPRLAASLPAAGEYAAGAAYSNQNIRRRTRICSRTGSERSLGRVLGTNRPAPRRGQPGHSGLGVVYLDFSSSISPIEMYDCSLF